jgi:hypothetical protein
MVRVLASGAVDHGFSDVMVRVLDSGDVDPGLQWCNGLSSRLWCCRSWVSVV